MKKNLLTIGIVFLCYFCHAQSYLPLAGGTLTGQVNGTNANFQNYILVNSATSVNTTLTMPVIYSSAGGGATYPWIMSSNKIINFQLFRR